MLVINCFKVFDLVQVMTGGGPGRATNVLVYEIYNEAFVKFNFGYASAIAMVLFIIVLAITVAQFKWNQHQESLEEKRWKQLFQKILEKQNEKAEKVTPGGILVIILLTLLALITLVPFILDGFSII